MVLSEDSEMICSPSPGGIAHAMDTSGDSNGDAGHDDNLPLTILMDLANLVLKVSDKVESEARKVALKCRREER